MSPGKRYEHAPVVEAILEFQVASPVSDLEQLRGLTDALPGWADAEHAHLMASEFSIAPDDASVSKPQAVAHIFKSGDSTLTVAPDRMAYSWAGDYTSWDDLTASAIPAWIAYRELARPTQLRRLGTRFINVIDIPSASIEIRDYLRTAVGISSYLPQALESFFLQVEIPLDDERKMGVKLTSTIGQGPPGRTSLILDLDTYKRCNLDLQDPQDGEGWIPDLAELRQAKDYVFEACITDATRGLIE
ncbi:TIGR04255 family protein [Kribbella sp. NPDC020789]